MSYNKTEEKTVIAENTLLPTAACPVGSRQNRPHGKSRRMKLLERMGCFGPLPPGVSIYRATTLDDLCDAYRLVHDSFVKEGYILPQPSGVRIRMFETLPETATFIAKEGENFVGATTVITDSPDLGLPSDKAFRKEIDQLRHMGRKVCEGTNWVITPEYRRTPVMTELMRCCFAHAIENGCTDLLADVSPSHQAFYELMAFELIGSLRNSSPDVEDPVVLVNLPITEAVENVADLGIEDDFDLAQVKVFYLDTNQYRDKVEQWATKAESAFRDSAFLRELFVEQSDFLDNCSQENLDIISQRWGEETFMDVMGHSVLCRSLTLPSVDYLSSITGFYHSHKPT